MTEQEKQRQRASARLSEIEESLARPVEYGGAAWDKYRSQLQNEQAALEYILKETNREPRQAR